jgi:hypothetical protein
MRCMSRQTLLPSSTGNKTQHDSSKKPLHCASQATMASSAVPRARPSTTSAVIDKLFGGDEHIVAFSGTSQYSQGGSSACGLAAMNCVRLVLDQEYRGRREDDLISLLCQQGIMTVRDH